ncbi:MAG: alpha-amylase family glycosyl hydrolase [Ignavibacteriales bacterium]|nr:alpha-amylase family glycosyl hydrolase [Ignavibacteriales bacterium]
MKIKLIALLTFFSASVFAQTTFVTTPTYPTQTDQITILFDITNATRIAGYIGNVYAHTGVTIVTNNGAPQRWQKVKGNWGDNGVQPQLTYDSYNHYKIVISNPRAYYLSIADQNNSNIKITELCFVLRSSDGTKQTEDIFVPLYSPGISVVLNSPIVNTSFGDPSRSPVFVLPGGTVSISVSTSELGTKTKSITLFINNIQKAQSLSNSLNYSFVANENLTSKNEIKIIASDTANVKDSSKFVIMRNPTIKNLAPPQGTIQGINYGSDPTKVTLALYAPQKSFVYVIGEFGNSDWKVDTTYFMNKFIPNSAKPDSVIWWTTISNLTSGQEYAYQFLIDGSLRIYDPYTDKILDPSNDSGVIASGVYPNLKSYPLNKTDNVVGILQTGQPSYSWQVPSFNRPSKEKLVIYELLIRDFVSTHSYKTLIDTLSYFRKLGVNAIELMPISEFEGNNSWGYNPMTYFAPDKYYGTKTDLKTFIDACHQNGIAVIMDIVLNHAYNSNSMAQMYWDSANSRPSANNPWFNTVAPHQCYFWGNDFNHESSATKYFVDRVTSFWLTEYKMDGFRFDFTKGFTNTPSSNTNNSCGSTRDPSRIAILERIASKIWNVSPNAYVILEHFADNDEEKELANFGAMLWGNFNSAYNQATMGYATNPSWDFSWISYSNRGWNLPGVDGYMESHDEERLMFKNLFYGNSSGSYNVKDLVTALNRIKLAATFFITVPGPKMIWMGGELGYDVSINTNGRLGEKPFAWNYFSNTDRKSLFNVFAGLIRLKKAYPVFSSTSFSISASQSAKSIHINDLTMGPSSMNVTIIGNFDVIPVNITPAFQGTGMWYEFFTGDSLSVTDVNAPINFQPGEYRLYTSKKVPKLDVITDVQNTNGQTIPKEFSLAQNYPNPFNPSTIISYQISIAGHVSLKVYDLLGREVATLVNEFKQPGNYTSQFSILNSQLSSGVYFYRISAGDFVETKKMIFLK